MNSNGDDNNILDLEKELEIKALHDEIQKLKNQVNKYKILLNEVDEDANPDMISDEEVICVTEISKLKKITNQRPLTSDEVKNLDILHKNLKLARGENTRVGGHNKVKKKSAEDLEKIVTGK
jgi:hypothetical protein